MENKKIIIDNLSDEWNNRNRQSTAGLMKTAIIEKTALPKNIQRKMASAVGTNIKIGNPTFYHPLFQTTNMMLPRDRRERNEWCRHFYRTEPIVATSLDLHTEFPISDFSHSCSDTSIKKFFDYMAFEKIDIINLLLNIGLEYWKIGDVFPFGQLNEIDGMWEKFTLLNPDYMDIQSSIFADEPKIELIPDANLNAIIQGGPRGQWADIYNQLPADIVKSIQTGRNIGLDNRLISHIAHKASQYETWGTPIMMRCFKTLIYKDKLRQAQDAIANRHIMPLRVAKVGMPNEPMPTQQDIDALRDTLLEADTDPNFFMVYHYGLSFDYVGSAGKILPLNQEFDFIQKQLMNGLGINQAMLNGEGPTYANAQVGFDTLARRYMSYRLRLESWIRHKVYKPISEIQGFYKPVNGEIASRHMSDKQKRISIARKEMQLIIPEITWQQQDLTGNQTVMNFIQQLQQKGLVSMNTVLPLLNLDPETEMKNLLKERGTVFDLNAPKTGPLPNTNSPINSEESEGPSEGLESPEEPEKPEGPKEPEPPIRKPQQNPNPVKIKNNPQDFGFPPGPIPQKIPGAEPKKETSLKFNLKKQATYKFNLKNKNIN